MVNYTYIRHPLIYFTLLNKDNKDNNELFDILDNINDYYKCLKILEECNFSNLRDNFD